MPFTTTPLILTADRAVRSRRSSVRAGAVRMRRDAHGSFCCWRKAAATPRSPRGPAAVADDCPVEAALRDRRAGGIDRAPSRLEADGPDARPGRPHHDVDPAAAAARRDALVHAVARAETGRPAHDGRPGLAAGGPATASARTVHAVDRSGVRDEGRGRHRPVSRSAAACRRVLHRREDRDPSAGSARSRAAAVARDAPNATGSSTTGTGRCRCTRPSTRRRAKWSGRRRPGTPARSSSAFSGRSWTRSPVGARSTSSWTISRRTKRSRSARSWSRIRRSISITRPRIRRGSTKSNSGSAKIERDVMARGIFTSVTDLRRKLMRYIKHYNTTATPIRWAYTDPSRRIA